MGNKKRTVAANKITMPDKSCILNGAVEINGTYVTKAYRLSGEQPFTEWLGGEITIKMDEIGKLQAYKDERLLTEQQTS